MNALLKAMCWEDPLARERFFVSVGGCRRRALGDNWRAFSVAEVFRSNHQWDFLVKRLRGELLKKKACSFLDHDLSGFFARIDWDQSGDVDVKELSSALMGMFNISASEEDMRELVQWFHAIDADRSGTISEDELSLFLGQLSHMSGEEERQSVRRSLRTQLTAIHEDEEHQEFLQKVSASELKLRKDQEEKELAAKQELEDSWAEILEEQLGENPRLEDSGTCAVFSFQQPNPPRFTNFVGLTNESVQDNDPRLRGQNLRFWSLDQSAAVVQKIPLKIPEAAESGELDFVDRYNLTMWFCLPQLPSERLTLIHWGKPETDLYSDLPAGEIYVWPDGRVAPEGLQEARLSEEAGQVDQELSTDFLLQLNAVSDPGALAEAFSALGLHLGTEAGSDTSQAEICLRIWLQVDSCTRKVVGGVLVGRDRCRFEGVWDSGDTESHLKLVWHFRGAAGDFEPFAELSGTWKETSASCDGEASTFNSLKDLFKGFRLSSQSFLGGLWHIETKTDGHETKHAMAVATQQGEVLQLDLGAGVFLSGCMTATDIVQKCDISFSCTGRPDVDSWVGQVSSQAMEGNLRHAAQDIGAWSAKRIRNPSSLRLPSIFLQRAVRWSSNKISAPQTEALSFRQFSPDAPSDVEMKASRKVYFEITLEERDSLKSVAWIPVSQPGHPHAVSLAATATKKAQLDQKTPPQRRRRKASNSSAEDSVPDSSDKSDKEEELTGRADVEFDVTCVRFSQGDVLGCLYNTKAGQASLSLNGKRLEEKDMKEAKGHHFPELVLHGGRSICINWGQAPFAFGSSEFCPLLTALCRHQGRQWRAEHPHADHLSAELGEGIPIHLQPHIESDIVDPERFYISLGDVILSLEETDAWLRHEWGWSPKSCFVCHEEDLEATENLEDVELLEDLTDVSADARAEDSDGEKQGKVIFSLRHHTLWKIVAGKLSRLSDLSLAGGGRHAIQTSDEAGAREVHKLMPTQEEQLRKLQLLAQRAGLRFQSTGEDPALAPIHARTCGVKVQRNHWHVLTISADLPFSMVFWLDGERILEIEPGYPSLRSKGPFSLVTQNGLSFFGMKGLCSSSQKKWMLGGRIREARIALGHLPSRAEILQVHQPRGVWLCRHSECERQGRQTRNSSTARTCWKCKTDKPKSGVAPPQNPDPKTGLLTLVADEFDKLVLDSDHSVFVDCTADWCGPSVQIKPLLYQLANLTKKLGSSSEDRIVVAMMDTDENEANPEYFPEPYIPNMKLFVKGENKRCPVKFDGERTLKGMLRFIEENTGVKDFVKALSEGYPAYKEKHDIDNQLGRLQKAVEVFFSTPRPQRCTVMACEVYQAAARFLLSGELEKVNSGPSAGSCDQVVKDTEPLCPSNIYVNN